jgi:hypothetical protein
MRPWRARVETVDYSCFGSVTVDGVGMSPAGREAQTRSRQSGIQTV